MLEISAESYVYEHFIAVKKFWQEMLKQLAELAIWGVNFGISSGERTKPNNWRKSAYGSRELMFGAHRPRAPRQFYHISAVLSICKIAQNFNFIFVKIAQIKNAQKIGEFLCNSPIYIYSTSSQYFLINSSLQL